MTIFHSVRSANPRDYRPPGPANACVQSRSLLVSIAVVAAGFALCGCAVIPPEIVTLSADVGQDVSAIKASHIFYINGYYDRLEAEADRFIDQEYAPLLIRTALNGESGKVLMQKMIAGQSGDQGAADAVAFMQRFLANVKSLVDAQRTAISGSIEGARKQALAQADSAYSQVAQGNATITAYLESLVKLHNAQNELLAAAGAPNLQDDIAQKLAHASDTAGTVLKQAASGEKSLDDVQKTLEDLKNAAASKK